MNAYFRRLIVAGCIAVLAACAGAPPEEGKTVDELLADRGLRVVGEVRQLINFNIRGFLYINRENVVLQDGPSRNYLVTLTAPCPNLGFASTIAFTSTGRVVRAFDKILVRETPERVEQCIIKSIHELEKMEK